jgi:L-serine dehydratase
MSLFRSQRGKDATMIFELDQNIDEKILKELERVECVDHVRFVPLSSNIINYPISQK